MFVDGPSCDAHRQWINECTASDPRCSWTSQDSSQPGIFGAMNQGFSACLSSDYLCFWGSDDWAPYPNMLSDVAKVLDESIASGVSPDLLVCSGRYSNSVSGKLTRATRFQKPGLLNQDAYRRALFFGSTPPHQGTFFGHGARQRISCYSRKFRLSADLDYFLRLSHFPALIIQSVDLEIVHMSDGGISGRQTWLRIKEVIQSYMYSFGFLWFVPFLARYLRRLTSLFFPCR